MSLLAVATRALPDVRRYSLKQGAWALVYLGLWLGFWQASISLNARFGISWFYPPAGLTLGLMLVFGARAWPLACIAGGLASLQLLPETSPLSLAPLVITSPLCYALYAIALDALGLRPQFNRLPDTVRFLATVPFGALPPALLGASLNVLALKGDDDAWLSGLLTWWMGDMSGILTVTPFVMLAAPRLLGLPQDRHARVGSNGRWLLLTLIACAVLGFFMLAGLPSEPTWQVSTAALILFLAIMFSGLWSGIAGAAGSIFVMTLVLIVLLGITPWHGVATPIESLLFALAVAGLLFGAAVTHQRVLTQRLETLVTERTAEARRKEASFRVLAEGSADVIALFSQRRQLLYLSPTVRELTGYASEDIRHSLPFRKSLVHPDDWDGIERMFQHLQEGQPVFALQYRVMHRNGEWLWLESRARLADNENLAEPHIVITTRDISGSKRVEDRLRMLANQDPLTGCLNRRGFEQLAGEELWRAQRFARPLTLLVLDIDHFKHINDRHGHDVGDQVLDHFCNLVREHCRRSEKFVRLGGEEFAILMPETDIAAATDFAERIRSLVEITPLLHVNGAISFTVSMGLTALRQDDDLPRLLKRADAALYLAKADGRNRVLCAD